MFERSDDLSATNKSLRKFDETSFGSAEDNLRGLKAGSDCQAAQQGLLRVQQERTRSSKRKNRNSRPTLKEWLRLDPDSGEVEKDQDWIRHMKSGRVYLRLR